ncbi:MAG: nucleotidyltransferase family protein [Burkholderiaceae bacterium]|nr:nucleotidyltransferase family protein [Burkholderiaceae bacterium]
MAAVVMAAGASRRMGGQPKCLLLREGEPLVARTVRLLREAGLGPLAVALGHHAPQVRAALAASPALARLQGWRIALNPDPNAGTGASLRAGLAALHDAPGPVLVALADQPLLEGADLAWLLAQWPACAAGQHLLVPTHEGQPGHPLIIDAALRRQVQAMPASQGVRQWRCHHPDQVRAVPVNHPRFHTDVDNPARFGELAREHGMVLRWPE